MLPEKMQGGAQTTTPLIIRGARWRAVVGTIVIVSILFKKIINFLKNYNKKLNTNAMFNVTIFLYFATNKKLNKNYNNEF